MGSFNDFTFKINLIKYLQTSKRTSDLLQFLAKVYNQLSSYQKNIKLLKHLIKKTKSPLKILKILALINMLLLTSRSIQLEDLIEILNHVQLSHKIEKSNNKSLNNYINEKNILSQYRSYLMKRGAYIEDNKILDQAQKGNDLVECYRILNLLNCGLQYHNSIFTFGRYFSEKEWFLIDFNIVLCIDFKEVYEYFKGRFNLIENKQTDNFELIKQIQEIHEKFNSIFLNIYHYSYIKSYSTQRIETNKIQLSPEHKKNRNSSVKKPYIFSNFNSTAERTIESHLSSTQRYSEEYQNYRELQKIVQCCQFNQNQEQISEISDEMVFSTILEQSLQNSAESDQISEFDVREQHLEEEEEENTEAMISISQFDIERTEVQHIL